MLKPLSGTHRPGGLKRKTMIASFRLETFRVSASGTLGPTWRAEPHRIVAPSSPSCLGDSPLADATNNI